MVEDLGENEKRGGRGWKQGAEKGLYGNV